MSCHRRLSRSFPKVQNLQSSIWLCVLLPAVLLAGFPLIEVSSALYGLQIVDPPVLPPGGGGGPVLCAVTGPPSVISGHSIDFIITGSGGTPAYRYLACACCPPVETVPPPGGGEPPAAFALCDPFEFIPSFPAVPNVFRVCGHPVGNKIVRAEVIDSLGAGSLIVEQAFEVLGPDKLKLDNNSVIVTVGNSNPFMLSTVWEFHLKRGDVDVGPCMSACALTSFWTPPTQPGLGWDPESNEPTVDDNENCACVVGQPADNCINPPVYYLATSCGPFTSEQWATIPDDTIVFRGAAKIRIFVPKCNDETLKIADKTRVFTCRKLDATRAKWTAK